MINLRKIASMLGSAVLIGSTVALAAAAYPAPFVQNGGANVAVVVGASAAAEDLLAAVDVTTDLAEKLASQTATGGTTSSSTASGGDSYKIERASTKFQLGNGILDVVSGTVTDSQDELPTLLADGTYTDSNNDDFDYSQKINLANNSLSMFEDSDYKADTPTVGMMIASGANVLNYTLDFTKDPSWANLETTDLAILGKTYYVLDSTVNTSLTLLDSADKVVISEGETKTVTVGAKSYEVKINYVGSNSTKLDINGEVTKSIAPGQTYKLSDGSYVGLREVNYNSKDTGISSVEFSIGKGKLVLENATDVEMNDDSISNLKAYFTNSAGPALSTLVLAWNAEEDLFVTTDSSPLMPGFEAVKLSFGGLVYPDQETITVDQGADDYVVLKDFPLKDSTETIDLLYFNSTNYTVIGKDATHRLITSANTSLIFDGDTDQYFVASWSDGINAESYLMRATNFKTESSVNKTTLEYRKSGSWVDASANAQAGDTVNLGSVTLTVGTIDKDDKKVFLTAGSGMSFKSIYSKEGMKVFLPWVNSTSSSSTNAFISNTSNGLMNSTLCTNTTAVAAAIAGQLGYNVTLSNSTGSQVNCQVFPATYGLIFSEEDKNENKALGKNITVTLGADSNSKVKATAVSLTSPSGTSTEVGSSDKFRNFVYSALATEVLWDKSGDSDTPVTLTYHGDEVTGDVYLTAPSTVVTPGDGSTGTLGSVTVKDNEISQVSTKNLIVVGGSCINTVAAKLLGSDSPLCGSSFTSATQVSSGQFLIKTFASPWSTGRVATLVAGYEKEDTKAAATYLTTQAVDTSVGKGVIVTSSSSAVVSTISA